MPELNLSAEIGFGRIGRVYKGFINGNRVAVKVCTSALAQPAQAGALLIAIVEESCISLPEVKVFCFVLASDAARAISEPLQLPRRGW